VAQLYTFKNFNHKDGLDVSNITSIAQTDDGSLWLGTFNSGIIKFNGKKFEEIHFKNKDNNHHITSINKSDKGVVYFSSRFWPKIYRFFNGKNGGFYIPVNKPCCIQFI
jgi:ligand-binding sensor domain-containing protein